MQEENRCHLIGYRNKTNYMCKLSGENADKCVKYAENKLGYVEILRLEFVAASLGHSCIT